jgi:hypothetical protein
MIEKRDYHVFRTHDISRIKIRITAVQRPCVTRDGCRRRRIRSSLGRPGLGDAARFQHRFGVLTDTFSHILTYVLPITVSVYASMYWKYMHAYTAADKAIYCSLEVMYVDIRTYTASYVSFTSCQYVIRTPTYV